MIAVSAQPTEPETGLLPRRIGRLFKDFPECHSARSDGPADSQDVEFKQHPVLGEIQMNDLLNGPKVLGREPGFRSYLPVIEIS
jgi:hypothetical protein